MVAKSFEISPAWELLDNVALNKTDKKKSQCGLTYGELETWTPL